TGTTLQNAGTVDLTNPITLGAGNETVNTPGGIFTVEGVISGAGGLTKTGTGRLLFVTPDAPTISQANTYAGGTTVTDGPLEWNRFHFVGATKVPDVAIPSATTPLQIGDGAGAGPDTVLLDLSNEIATDKPVNIASDGVLDLGASNSQAIGPLTLAPGSLVTGAGSSTLTLDVSPVTVTSGAGQAIIQVPNLDLTGPITFNVPANGNGTNGDLLIKSSIHDGTSSGTLNKAGAGNLQLANTAPNT